MNEHSDFVTRYQVPVVAPDAPRPTVRWARRGEGRLRTLVGRTRRIGDRRRLAYVDSHFPWQRSGFRYADALALHAVRPDTVFFSMYAMRDPFPAPVFALADFPRLAPMLGITDVYGVFLDFMTGIVGLGGPIPGAPPGPIEGLDLSSVIRRDRLRVHAGVYPGGGLAATESSLRRVSDLVAAADRVFSWSVLVIDGVDHVLPIRPAVIDTAYYQERRHRFGEEPLEVLFAADDRPRKGADVALRMMVELAGEPVHLHVVGPHDPAASRVGPERATFHGWLERDALRALHRRCQVFISPVTAEVPDDATGDGGVTDGFPTAAAAEAMSSGLLLISANPDEDRRHLRPEIDFLERPADPAAFAEAVRGVLRDPVRATSIAVTGARRVRDRYDVRVGVAERLAIMGLDTPGSPMTAPHSVVDSELDELRGQVSVLTRTVSDLRRAQLSLSETVVRSHRQLMDVGKSLVDDEGSTRTELLRLRAEPGYEMPFTDTNPLVTVCVPTYRNVEMLIERCLPSLLAQEHRNLEVVVIGDDAPGATGERITAFGDPRVRYENLGVRGPYPDDPRGLWFVAGTGPLNRALELARGQWIAINNDDDALRPDHISGLLAEAQRTRDEVVYGQLIQHAPDGGKTVLGQFPPASHAFGWQLALQHRAMRMFDFKLTAAAFDEPGDWNRARRMLRAGVRFRMIDQIVCDYYPGQLWQSE